ncbi:RHS repeat-associated core domain-containing protein [Psychromonas arctica]|uniref:RHS repeat-associated core domain-containing protein n=1 Tax=Psychromonas arctica TaxID=168275 RepID=UPI002FD579D7
MAQMHIFNVVGKGNYLLNLKGSAIPNGYVVLSLSNDNDIKMFVEMLIAPLYKSANLLGYAKSLVGINYPVDMKVLAVALQSAIKQKNVAVFKEIANDNTPESADTWSQIVGAAMVVAAGTSSEGKETEEKKVTGSAVSEEKSAVPTDAQAKCGDPVSMLSGEEILSLQDFELPGLLPLVWRRIYRSSKTTLNTGLGYGWRHSFSLQLIDCYQAPPKVGPKQQGTHWFELIDEEGTTHHFNKVQRGQTSYQPSAGLALLNDGESKQILIRPDGTHWCFTKEEDVWLLTSINNELGHGFSLIYDHKNRLVSIMVTSKRGVMIRYNSDNNISKIIPYLMNEEEILTVQTQILASYQYNEQQSLISATDSKGATEAYQYHKGSLLKQRTRASGFNHYFEWSGEGETARCSRQWGDDDTYDYRFTFEGNKSTSTDSLGNTEQYFHNEQDLLTLFIDANGNKTAHQYDDFGRKVSTTDAMGQTTAFNYNEVGQLIQETAPDNSTTRYVYNAFGKRVVTIDALGRQFKRQFNATGRLLTETTPDGQVTEYKYNSKGQLTEKIMPDGQRTLYQWNDSGELLAEKTGEALTRYSYDKLGHLNAICDAQNLITEYQRNEQGQVTQQVSYPQAEATADKTFPESAVITRYVYDKAGRLTNIVSPNGDSTHYGYGGLAQPTKKTFADGSWLNYQYDKERNLIGIERSDEATYKIEYSPTEKPTKLIGFDGRVQTYQYDNNDKLIAVNDADERMIQLKRDSLGNIVDQHSFTTHSNKQLNFNSHNLYQYDAIGCVTLAHNSDRVVQQQYHLNGQINQSKQGDWTLNYQFNNKGQRSQLTLPDGKQLDYQYNELGQLSRLNLQSESEETTLLALQYSVVGQITEQALGNGITLEQDYDVQSRLTRQSWVGKKGYHQHCDYQYDKQNQLIKCNESTQSDESAQHTQAEQLANTEQKNAQQTERTFTYNKLSQLVGSVCEFSQPSKHQTEYYNWDAFGNPEVDYSVAKADRDTRIENDRLLCSGGVDYRYDKSGNQISSIATGLIQKRSFDGLNQLRQINNNGKVYQYQYDALGRRSAKITETGRTDFIWDGNQLIGEVSHGEYTWYIYLPDSFEPIALIKDNQIYYYHLDQLGTPICLTDVEQKIVWENQGDLFGCEDKKEQDSLEPEKKNNIENPLRFQGQYFDGESGLHYNRFRYYCPKQGRFIHQDPIGLNGGINHYQYAPNPVNWIDPFGLCAKEDVTAGDRLYASFGYIGGVTKKAGDTITGAVEYSIANPQQALYAVDSAIGSAFDVVVDAVNYFPDALILKPLGISVGSADQMNARLNGIADGVSSDWAQHNELLSNAWETADVQKFVEAGEVGSDYVLAGVGGVASIPMKARSMTTKAFHVVDEGWKADSILEGINPKYFNPDSRFGGGFYIGNDGTTVVKELAEHGFDAKYAIRYDVDFTGSKVLDLTDPHIANNWGFIPKGTSTEASQVIGQLARDNGYDAITFSSYRGSGTNTVIFDKFDEILTPMMVTPIK